MKIKGRAASGFTIVELLIVIVVIGILAAIVIVAFNGVQNRAKDTAVRSDVSNLVKKMEEYRVLNDRYPISSANLETFNFRASKGGYQIAPTSTSNLTYCWVTDGSDAAVIARSQSNKIFLGRAGSVTEYTGTWQTSSSTRCTDVDASLTANYNGYASTDTTNGPWRAWAGGN